MNKLPYSAVLWGKDKLGDEVILSERVENILPSIPLARRDGYTDLRIAIYDDSEYGFEALDEFVRTL